MASAQAPSKSGSESGSEPGSETNPGSMKGVLKSSTLYLLGNVVGRVVGFLAIPFYAHFLSPAEYGLLELIELSTQTVALAFGLQAIGVALSRVYYDQKTAVSEHEVVSTALLGTAAISGTIVLLAAVAARPLSEAMFHTDAWAPLLRAAFLAMFFGNMIEVVLVYERIRNHARFYLAYSLTTLALTLGLNILFIGFLRFGVWGFVSSKLVVTAGACLYLATRVQRDVGWRFRLSHVPEFVRFGGPLIVSGLAYFAIHFSDRFFLSSSVSLADLGRYALAYRFAFLVSAVVGDSFSKTWEVTLYRYTDQPGWQAQFARVASYLTYVLFATGLGIALFSPEMLRIMVPADYLPPALLLPILIGSYVAREVGDFFRSLLMINKRVGMVGRISVAGAMINLIANALLIPRYGTDGAAVATLVTWLIYMVVCWRIANSEHGLPVSKAAYLRATVLLVVVYALNALTRSDHLVLQIAMDTAWFAVFCVSAFFVLFSAAERRAAVALCGSLIVWLMARGGHAAAGEGALQVVLLHGSASSPLAGALNAAGVEVVGIAAADMTPEDAATLGLMMRIRLRATSWALRGSQRLLFPFDDRLDWLPATFDRALQAVQSGTILLSTPTPRVTHLTALALKQRTGLPWIADLGEDTADKPGGWRRARLDPAFERMIAAHADAILVGNEDAATRLRARHPTSGAKVHVAADPDDGAMLLRVIDLVRTGNVIQA